MRSQFTNSVIIQYSSLITWMTGGELDLFISCFFSIGLWSGRINCRSVSKPFPVTWGAVCTEGLITCGICASPAKDCWVLRACTWLLEGTGGGGGLTLAIEGLFTGSGGLVANPARSFSTSSSWELMRENSWRAWDTLGEQAFGKFAFAGGLMVPSVWARTFVELFSASNCFSKSSSSPSMVSNSNLESDEICDVLSVIKNHLTTISILQLVFQSHHIIINTSRWWRTIITA